MKTDEHKKKKNRPKIKDPLCNFRSSVGEGNLTQ